MKRVFAVVNILALLFLLAAVSLSCGAGAGIQATLGQEFTLPVGKTATFESESLTVRFVDVITDSRCPAGVECIWAGEAQCRLFFTLIGSAAEMIVVQPGGDVYARDYFIYYKIDFKLEPYPQEGQQIAPSDYKLVMTVSKKGS